jgi:putative aldouronate transport system substrate-binding protein
VVASPTLDEPPSCKVGEPGMEDVMRPLDIPDGRRIDRRTFLKTVFVAGLGASLLLEACAGPVSTPVQAGPTGTAPSSVKAILPTYIPSPVLTPDLAPGNDGLQAGYLTYPRDQVQTVRRTPGLGGDVTALSSLIGAPSPPIDQNPAWQAVNKQINANMKVLQVAQSDYMARAATIMAGNDFPDLFALTPNTLGIAQLPQFLKSSYADLTPYLAGDAIKDYPNLAAFPTSAWTQCVFDGAILAVPNLRPQFQFTWFVNQSKLDALGASHPRTGDEFKRLLKELTRPQSNEYGIVELAPGYGLVYNGPGNVPMLAMFGTPNNWSVDSAGKFTKDIETEQFKAALGFTRDLYAMGVYFPDPTLGNASEKIPFKSGNAAINANGWVTYLEFWNDGINQKPPVKFRVLDPISFDGGKPIRHRFNGVVGMTAIKKGSSERVKELLRIEDFLAAPFGSQESLLLEYGVKDVDFAFDVRGNPLKTAQGQVDTLVPWVYLGVHPPVLYNPIDSDFARTAYAEEQTMLPLMVNDPSVGLYSPTDASKGGQLAQKFAEGLGEIVTGRSPLSNLNQLLSDWRAGGGDQVRRDYEELYAASLLRPMR